MSTTDDKNVIAFRRSEGKKKKKPVAPKPKKPPRNKDTRHVFNDLDRSRQRKLYARYELEVAKGKRFNLSRMSVRWGYSRGRLSQFLHGHEPLNTHAMLIWAFEIDCSPSEIWDRYEWAFDKLTPTLSHPVLRKLVQQWGDLSSSDQESIRRIVNR